MDKEIEDLILELEGEVRGKQTAALSLEVRQRIEGLLQRLSPQKQKHAEQVGGIF